MNYRTSIADALVERLKKDMDGSDPAEFFTNVYGNVSRQTYSFEQINEFPYIAVHVGTETGNYLPSAQQWVYLEIPILIYDKEKDDINMQLEKLIADVKTSIDTGGNLQYTIMKPDGSTIDSEATDMQITSVSTDEGILSPFGFAQVNVTVRYMPLRRALDR